MNRLIRWYNKNRKIFWLAIVITIIVIKVPRALNEYAKDKKNVSSSINNNTTTYNNNYSIISNKTIKNETSKVNTNIINTFIDYCNNRKPEDAYEILSEECKQNLYPTLDEFINKYYNRIFENKKSYSIEAWFNNERYYTYKINLKEDILSTGNANSPTIEDYYTIVYNKLNINSYIGSIEVNKSKETGELRISILSKDVFMEYEIYNLEVESKNGKSILLDSLENTNTMYLQDSGGLHYDAYSHELVREQLRVRGVKDISIKFNKKYTTQRDIEKIVFNNIILDYNSYITYEKKSDFEDRAIVEIEL